MQPENTMRLNRRTFAGLFVGMAIAAFSAQLKPIRACMTRISHAGEALIMDRSMPMKSPRIVCVTKGDAATFCRRGDEKPIFATNLSGKWIWDACDGKTPPREISSKINQTCDVSRHRAHQDCVAFLCQLKKKGLIRV